VQEDNRNAQKPVERLWVERLAEFKSQENPEVVLLLPNAPDFIRITTAWTITAASPRAKLTQPPQDGGANAWWNWLWENAEFSLPDLVQKADLSEFQVGRKLQVLIGNRIIYPDGTVNSFVQRYLRDKVPKLFQLKNARTSTKKE
jgi:hypothetical protein